jgi:hypothetical protein
LVRACGVIGICLRTFKRWRKAFLVDGNGEDRRNGSGRLMSHQLSEEERQRILLTCNQPEYATLPPGQIVPALADQVQRACLKERCHRPSGFGSRQCQQSPLILHADNGNALAAGFCLQ